MDKRTPSTFFIAGTMQGSRRADNQLNQSYRQQIRSVITRQYPSATVNCPLEIMKANLSAHEAEIRNAHAALATVPIVERLNYEKGVNKLTDMFCDLVAVAASCDVCVSYLPNHEASMGTAVEMWNSFANGKLVIAISKMRQNLAVLSCSSVIVPSVDAFEDLIASGWLEQNFAKI